MPARHLRFHFTLRDDHARVLDTSRGGDPLECREGAGQIIAGLEQVLRTMQPGDQREVVVPPELGYGLREESLVQPVPRAALPVASFKAGDRFQTGPNRADPVVTVVRLDKDKVWLDANHPLAGQTLRFEIELVAARRAATKST